MNRLRQLWGYARKVFDLGRRLRHTREGRVYPQIPAGPVVTSLFLGALLRVPSWLHLAKQTRKANWQRLVRHAAPLNHETFNYVSEFLALDALRAHLYAVACQVKANKGLERAKLGGLLVVALDANECFASRSHCCAACCTRTVQVKGADGQVAEATEYYHRAVFAQVMGADVLLDLEPIRPGEEEAAAALRLLARLRRELGVRFFDVVSVDAWYTTTPFLRAVLKLGWETVAVLKRADLEASQEADALAPAAAPEHFEAGGRQVALREVREVSLTQAGQVQVRVVLADEHWEERQRRGKTWVRQARQSHWRWVATRGLDAVPARVIWQMGHGRWGIENQGFNQLTRDYHLKHCCHHHPVAMVAWLLLTLLAVNLTTLFYRHWLAPRAADCTLRDLVEAWREALLEPADWAACLDSS